jgi:hypothetical protein
MTVHLNKFIDRVRAQESRAGRDFVMSMTDARDLHADITRLLLELNRLREAAVAGTEKQVIEVKMQGGNF